LPGGRPQRFVKKPDALSAPVAAAQTVTPPVSEPARAPAAASVSVYQSSV
jgi:hypothetical protein